MRLQRTAGPIIAAALVATATSGWPLLSAAELVPSMQSAARVVAAEAGSQFISLGVGKSVVVELSRDVKDVLVSDPKIANAVVRTSRRAFIIGVGVGQTNIFFFDSEARPIAGFDLAVKRDLNGIRAALRQRLPKADITVEGMGDGVVLAGNVANPGDAQRAYDIASRLVGDSAKVVNSLGVQGGEQVMLKVTVAEVQRNVVKQLGINLSGRLAYGTTVVNFNTDNPFSVQGQPLSNSFLSGSFKTIEATLRAMEQAGVMRTLAEPNLTAISGESANFLAGGEFPVFGGISCSQGGLCQTTVLYKKFGVALSFTPVVLSEGRISLHVKTEVSELTNEFGLTIPGGGTIPGIKTRQADTTVEIPSGGSLAMAGMIQEATKQQINGIPALMQLPILGTLFKSRDYLNNQTELTVIVTPYVVRAVAQKELSRSDDGFADASDPATILLGRLNRIYGVAERPLPPGEFHGNIGFIID